MSLISILLGLAAVIALPVAANHTFNRPVLMAWPIVILAVLAGWMLSQAYRYGPDWLIPVCFLSIGLSLVIVTYRLIQRRRSAAPSVESPNQK